jgi:hypothetical protein
MLTVLNLYVVDKIFNEEATIPLKPITKMLYINCLTYHFKDKKPIVSNAIAFEIFIKDIPNYDKHEKSFQELHKSGLIAIGLKTVVFNNVWGQHIDRSKLDKVDAMLYVAGFTFHKPITFKKELDENQSLFELCAMKYKINQSQVKKLIELFIKEQSTFEKTYSNFSDCIRHFTMWAAKNLDKVPKEIVKSNNKILGLQ